MRVDETPTQESIKKILKGITIPSPPQIIADLQMEMAMPDPDLNQMASMISKDPGLAGSVLKTLNSPYYGNRDISSISKAVMMLGMTTVANIVNTLCMHAIPQQMEPPSDEIIKAMAHFWDSATDVARASRLVSNRLKLCEPDFSYMIGLFHNAGIPLLMQRFSDYPSVLSESYQLSEKRIIDIENNHYKTNHAVISFYAARSWKLPKTLCNVIGQHHNLDIFLKNENETSDEKNYLAVLKIAEHLAGLAQTIANNDSDEEWNQIENAVLQYIGISKFDFDDLALEVEDNGIGGQGYFM